ncbi:hypothetical protein Q4F19_16835 [Sphingomonas sp. BIUV-7]|uniref:Uncharacterized protein n=1 Tax=Sphingomonas natans TaxID=3063330 RepID=A0ABT8YCJ7_9SPHN|nr:hypothetical protein [Sphingomonas sp. BIUV-7]MDO6416057.1 hypothetical protein [Sphingomonas sp. BIUV-7]
MTVADKAAQLAATGRYFDARDIFSKLSRDGYSDPAGAIDRSTRQNLDRACAAAIRKSAPSEADRARARARRRARRERKRRLRTALVIASLTVVVGTFLAIAIMAWALVGDINVKAAIMRTVTIAHRAL